MLRHGEMIAVKQVEIPQTAAIGMIAVRRFCPSTQIESEIFQRLDHPNVVQYLGFEETPNFLEHVRGFTVFSHKSLTK